MLQAAADLPALGATGHRARPAPLAGISVLLVPHQGAVVAQALHAVPPVPAAPAEVFEAHLVGGEGGEKPRCQHQQCVCVGGGGAAGAAHLLWGEGAGIPGSLHAVRRYGLGEHSPHLPPTRQRPD